MKNKNTINNNSGLQKISLSDYQSMLHNHERLIYTIKKAELIQRMITQLPKECIAEMDTDIIRLKQ